MANKPNQVMNNFIRQASGHAPPATEQPQTPKVPAGHAGSGAGQTGVFTPKQDFNVWLRSYAGKGRY